MSWGEPREGNSIRQDVPRKPSPAEHYRQGESHSTLGFLTRTDKTMPFTYVASPSSSGNNNIRRVCSNPNCGGVFFISYGAENYRCPHCDRSQ